MTTPTTQLDHLQVGRLVRLLRVLVEDFRNEKTVLEHIDSMGMPEIVGVAIVVDLTDWLLSVDNGYEDTLEGRRTYLEHYQRIMGVSNSRFISDLREWLYEAAP